MCNTGSETIIPIGQCFCKKNVEGRRCNKCKQGFRNLQNSNIDGCERKNRICFFYYVFSTKVLLLCLACVCNINGTIQNEGCSPLYGACRCKKNVVGSKCDECKPNYYGLHESNPDGCKPCDCSIEGSAQQQCHSITGQCQCRPHAKGKQCEQIEPGFYCPGLDHLKYNAANAIKLNSEASLLEKSSLLNYPIRNSQVHPGRKLLIKTNGEVIMNIEQTEISGRFQILLRYESDDEWQVNMKISAIGDQYSLAGDTCDKYSYEKTLTLENGEFCERENYFLISLVI